MIEVEVELQLEPKTAGASSEGLIDAIGKRRPEVTEELDGGGC